jgi:outer membrane cobalamin receptor
MNSPRRHIVGLLLSAALMLGFFSSARAATPADAKELDAIVVAASRSQTRVEEMPQHTTVISREDIAKSPA